MPSTDLFIGIDIGTSKLRVSIIDQNGSVVADAAVPMPAAKVDGAAITQSPSLWWDAVAACLPKAMETVDRASLRALSVAGTSGTVLLVAPDGTPITDAIMYNDQASLTEAAQVADIAPAGSPALGAASTLARVLRLRAGTSAADFRAMHQADWIAGRLRGAFDAGDENNALKLGYDPVRRDWPEWIFRSGLRPEQLCRIVPPGTALGPISADIAAQFGLPADLQIVAGTTDSVAATLATGLSELGDAVTSLGSTLVLKVATDRPIADAASGVYTHRVRDLWLAGGASNTGGAVLRHYFTDAQLAELSARIDPSRDADRDYYPLLRKGERFPQSDPDLAPRLTPRPDDDADFLASMFAAMARIERDGYRRLEALGAPYPRRILTAGGGARNGVWMEMRRKALGVPVDVAPSGEASVGAALLARDGVAR